MSKFNSKVYGHKALKIAGTAADMLGVECYVVGGYVRDILLGKKNNDFDFVVVGSGIEVANKVADVIPGSKVSVYESYGTASVRLPHGDELEFVGARKEFYHRESRNPIVENGTLMDDLSRRDFTINAMAVCVNSKRFGQLIDEFGGREDLVNKVVRCVGNPMERFDEDPLRILRGIRFAGQIEGTIEDSTLEAMKALNGRLSIITQERITTEIEKMFTRNPSVSFNYFFQVGLQEVVLPYRKYLSEYDPKKILSTFDDMLIHGVLCNTYAMWHTLLRGSHFTYKECAEKLKLSNDTLNAMTNYVTVCESFSKLYTSGYGSEYFALNHAKFLNECGKHFKDMRKLLISTVLSVYNASQSTYYSPLYDFPSMLDMADMLLSINREMHWSTHRPEYVGLTGVAVMQALGIGKGEDVGKMKGYINDLILTGRIAPCENSVNYYLRRYALRDYNVLKQQYNA